jgi:ATP-dependent helicase/nuclease subunit B
VPTLSQPELLDAIDAGEGLFLLPNARAARDLRSAFNARQRARGIPAWDPPPILSWSQWTNSLWSELIVAGAETRLLLNRAQEHSLWREIVSGHPAMAGLLSSADALAELAGSGWLLAASYEATHRLRSFAATHDSRIFADWAEAFTRQCGTRGYVSAALLEDTLKRHLEAGALAAPPTLQLVGFAERTPAQEALLDALRARGTVVFEHALMMPAGALRACVVAPTERAELELAARWIRSFVEQQPAARVALLVPQLSEERAELEEVLRETLAPELQSVSEDLSSTPWEFSTGSALSSMAMISDALALARWSQGPMPVQRVSALLMSPYLGQIADRDASARFDAATLRRTQLLRSEIEIAPLLALADDAQRKHSRPLLAWLRNLQTFLQRDGDRSRPRGCAEWMEFVRGLAQAANWPGDRPLTATEFEATQAWESALDTVSTLDFSGRRVALSTALEALELQAQTTALAPPFTGAAVQIMSVAEAEASVFDAVVFLRATDANWPPTTRQHPLLPWALQRSLKMPGTDPGLAAARARAFTEGLLARAGSMLFTSATEDSSGMLRSSPLLAGLRLQQVQPEELVAPAAPAITVETETSIDAEPLPNLPSLTVKGGATVLKLQAACGFKAFAELRLLATEPQSGVLGLDARESGSLLHRTMQTFWTAVETQKNLRAMSWTQRETALAQAIDAAFGRKQRTETEWDRAYIAVLKQRLRSVLQQWLDVELQRGDFSVIESEQEQQITVGPLTLDLRMDRIDSVDGGFFLVDYKSGFSGTPKDWIGDRPDDPQLPLYALLYQPEELRGLAFAKVRAGRDMKWIGYQAEDGILPRSPSKKNIQDLTPLIAQWHEILTTLAFDFADGRAYVLPKSFKDNCSRCAQRLLCRVDPLSLPLTDEEELEAVDG